MGCITDITGITVGHYTDPEARTGCTAVLCEAGAVAGVDVRGSAPGTRETDLLRGYNAVERVQAIMLCGGSAYGLDAASGAMRYLEEKRLGTDVGLGVVPIVPAAVIFDLGVGRFDVRPDAAAGYAACKNAVAAPEMGRVGVGCGATIGKAFGNEFLMPGGVGTSCITLANGVKVAAIVAVNALGDVYDPDTGRIVAGANKAGQFLNCMSLVSGAAVRDSTNTTIGVVATDAKLNREQANKLASMAHDGLAMAIRPVHTSLDGDTFFSMATGEKECEFLPLMVSAVKAVTCAVLDAVRER